MNRAALSIVLVVGLVISACTAGTPGATDREVGATPPLAPSVPASMAPSPLPSVSVTDTSVWVPLVSERYGYTMSRPPAWTATGGTRDWEFDTDRIDFTTPAADRFHSDGYPILVTAFAVDVPSDMSDDEWINAYYEGSKVGSVECDTLIDLQPISVDGHPGSIAVNDACEDAQAFVFIDGRVHVFAVWRADQEALLEAFLSTVEFEE